jgi:hypothetical protein
MMGMGMPGMMGMAPMMAPGPAAPSGPIVIPEGKLLGEVKNWNDEKGFGFIIPEGACRPPRLARGENPNARQHTSIVLSVQGKGI